MTLDYWEENTLDLFGLVVSFFFLYVQFYSKTVEFKLAVKLAGRWTVSCIQILSRLMGFNFLGTILSAIDFKHDYIWIAI